MSDFCKVFRHEKYGQILAKIDANDDGIPEVRWYVQPPDLGVCTIAVSFTDDDEGWALADKAFEKSDDLEFCAARLAPIFKMFEESA